MWQRHGLRMEEFAAMDKNKQHAYIASELYEDKNHSNYLNCIAFMIQKRWFKK